MLHRLFTIRKPVTLACIATLLVVASVATNSTGRHARLRADELAHARGTNNGFTKVAASCDTLAGNQPCPQANGCVVCDVPTYDNVSNIAGAFLKGAAGQGNCGNAWLGTCDAQNKCNQKAGGNSMIPCSNVTPGAPTKQQLGGG